MPPSEPLDEKTIEDIHRMLGGQPLKSLVGAFRASAMANVEQLKAAAARGDATAVLRESHDLKGSAGNLGLTEIAALAAAVEYSCDSGRMNEATGHIEALPPALERALAELSAYLKRTTSP